MGTTLTMAHIVWPRLYVVHAGDSRCYLIRNGRAEQLTTDHTMARKLVESGGLRPEEEATSRWSNVLWNVLGGRGEGELIAEVRCADLNDGDYLLLCSDGLHRYIDSDEIAEIVTRLESPSRICESLVELANEQGGEDNITVVVAQPRPPRHDHSTTLGLAEPKTSDDPPNSDSVYESLDFLHDTDPG